MKSLNRILAALAVISVIAPAYAQVIQPGTVLGNSSGSARTPTQTQVTGPMLSTGAAAANLGFTPAASGANADITSLSGLTTPLGAVTTNANLSALPSTTATSLMRYGFSVAGDGPAVSYSPQVTCTLGGGNDGGGCVPTSDGKYWVLNRPDVLDLRIWGADPTGATDAGPAFANACLDFPGATFVVPAGVFLWNTAETLTSECSFVGQGFNERNQNPGIAEQGTWIKVTNASINPVTFNTGGDGGGGGFRNLAFEQTHPTPAASWAPTAYGPLITLLNTNTFVLDNVYLYDIYSAVNIPGTSGATGRIQMSHIKGQVFSSLLTGTEILDVEHLDDIHLWTFWSSNINVLDWTMAHGTPINTKRLDGLQSDHMFMIGYQSCLTLGYESTLSQTGPSTNVYIGDLYCDASAHAVTITGNNTRLHIGKLTFGGESLSSSLDDTHGAITGSSAVYDAAIGARVVIDNLQSQESGGPAVLVTNAASGENIIIGAPYAVLFNRDNNGYAAFEILATTGTSIIDLGVSPTVDGSGPLASVAAGGLVTNVWLPWTPTIAGAGTAGTPTYTSQTGEYMVSGRLIYAKGSINETAIAGSPTGAALIAGFPWPNESLTANYGTFSSSTMAYDTGYTSLSLSVSSVGTTLGIFESGSGVGTQALPIGKFTSGAAFSFSFTSRLF